MELTRETTLAAVQPMEGSDRQPAFGRPSLWRRTKDVVTHRYLGVMTVAVCLIVVLMAILLVIRSWPILRAYSLPTLLTGQIWHPLQGLFGFAPFIVGSITVTGVAMILAVLPAIFSGIYLAEYTSQRSRSAIKPWLDVLVGIPSVIYGLWGVLFVVPLVRDHVGPFFDHTLGQALPMFRQTNPSGYGLLAAGCVLAIMVFPLIVAVTEEVLRTAPREMREALLALGATRWEATKCIVMRRGLAGILAAIVLGFSRAFGETLAVMMVIGNIPQIPKTIFDGAYPLPALIANNYGEMMSVPLYESALMGAALLLLAVVLVFNAAARLVIVRVERRA